MGTEVSLLRGKDNGQVWQQTQQGGGGKGVGSGVSPSANSYALLVIVELEEAAPLHAALLLSKEQQGRGCVATNGSRWCAGRVTTCTERAPRPLICMHECPRPEEIAFANNAKLQPSA